MKHYFDYSEVQNSSMVFTNKITGHKIMPYGLVEAEKTKGISQATHVFVDEITECSKESIDMIDSVLRTPQAEYLQFICAFNPVDESNFIRDYFFSKNDINLPREDYGDDLLLHHSTLKDNEYIDQEAYETSLIRKYGHNQNLLDVNLYGKWGRAEVDKPYITTFDKNKHVGKFDFDRSDILLSFDFNVDPITCVASQIRGGIVYFIEEYRLRNSDIWQLCTDIKSKLPKSNYIIVTGDSTGKNRQAISKGGLNYYHVIKDELNLHDRVFNIPGMNHSNQNSREIMNRAFHFNKCLVNESMTYLIKDLIYCEADMHGNLVKKTSGEGKELSHLLDAFKYSLVNVYRKELDL
jgi:PBSX family phage terminase large subunit